MSCRRPRRADQLASQNQHQLEAVPNTSIVCMYMVTAAPSWRCMSVGAGAGAVPGEEVAPPESRQRAR